MVADIGTHRVSDGGRPTDLRPYELSVSYSDDRCDSYALFGTVRTAK
jgi:hypothetical protein